MRYFTTTQTTLDNFFFQSYARSLVVYCCCRFLLSEPCEDTSWRLRLEIADSSLRNAPRSVSRASTSFRDDCRGGLSVFCCPLLSLVVYCCSSCRFLLSFPSQRGNLLLFLVVTCCRFISFTNYFYAIFSIAFVSSYFFISSSRFPRQTNEPPFFMRLTICCSFSLSCDLPFSALRSIGLDTILNINL